MEQKHNSITEVEGNNVKPPYSQTHCWLSGRLTTKKLVKWVNEQFKNFELKYEVTEISRTHFNTDAYEGGACRLLVKFRNINMEVGSMCSTGYFMCFYKISEYEEYLKNGYELYLRDKSRFGILNNFEIEVRKR